MKKNDLIKQFEFELNKNVIEMNKLRKFNGLQRILDEYGYFEGARKLINKDETVGLADLFAAGKKEISIEFLALDERFKSLFTKDELKKCRCKLGM